MSEPTNATACPSWCGGDHLDGGVHRGVVGDVLIGGKDVLVVILQTPGGGPSVTVSGPVIVQVAPDDHADAAALFALLGHDELADLVRRAARIVEDAVELTALEARAAQVVEDADDAQDDAEPVRASVPGTWPNGEPADVRSALAEDEDCIAEFIDGTRPRKDCNCIECRERTGRNGDAR